VLESPAIQTLSLPDTFASQSNDQSHFGDATMTATITTETLYAILPLLPPTWLLLSLLDNPIPIVMGWIDLLFAARLEEGTPREIPRAPTVGSQLLAYLTMAIFGYIATYRLVPNIQVGEMCLRTCVKGDNMTDNASPPLLQTYTLRKGICGKDLGKRGTATADKEM